MIRIGRRRLLPLLFTFQPHSLAQPFDAVPPNREAFLYEFRLTPRVP